MGSNGSFYQNGLPISTEETGVGNVPSGLPVANKANSSFYLSGTVYNTLESADVLLAAITAQQQTATTDAASAASSASAAAASLAAMAPSGTTPLMDGVAAAGASPNFSRGDHVHPTDTSRAPLASPALTGTPTAPTPAVNDNSLKLATTAFLMGQLATVAPLMDGTASVGVSTLTARQDHVHPTDTSRAPLASPALTGTPTAPTPSPGDNSANISTTAFVTTAIAPLVGAVVYKGTWNASTNSPALSSGVGTKGWLYKVSVTGTTTIDGVSQWNVGDSIVFDGTTWDKIDGVPTEVISVAGRTGAVSLAVADVSGAAPLASPSLTGTPTAPTASSRAGSTQIATTSYVDSATREKLTVGRTYYVATTGNDSNSGLSSGAPFLTIQRAINVILSTLDLGGQTVTVSVANGTYSYGFNLSAPFIGGGAVKVIGNTTTPTSCIISATGDCFDISNYSSVIIQGFRITSSGVANGIATSTYATANIAFMDFGTISGAGGSHMFADTKSSIIIGSNYSISGNATYHMAASYGGGFKFNSATVTFTANFTCTYFSLLSFGGQLQAIGITYSLGAFTVTGSRFNINDLSFIQTNTGNANYFPGSTAGSTNTGSQYN